MNNSHLRLISFGSHVDMLLGDIDLLDTDPVDEIVAKGAM